MRLIDTIEQLKIAARVECRLTELEADAAVERWLSQPAGEELQIREIEGGGCNVRETVS